MPGFLNFDELSKKVAGESRPEEFEPKEIKSGKAAKAHEKLAKVQEDVKQVVSLFEQAGLEDASGFVAEQIRIAGMPRPKGEGAKAEKGKDKKSLVVTLIKDRLKK